MGEVTACPSDCPLPGAEATVLASGPIDAPLVLVGEAAGTQEAFHGVPFFPEAPAGSLLGRLLKAVSIDRDACRIANVFRCHPQNDYIPPSYEGRMGVCCRPYLDSVLSEPHKVIVPMGGTAIRAVMNLPRKKGKEAAHVADFHGTVNRAYDRWVVPTFHPSFLLRGNQRLFKTLCYDLATARDLASGNLAPNPPELLVDPGPEEFEKWVKEYLSYADRVWLNVDVETPDKRDNEAELISYDSTKILRINLGFHPDLGVTVPWVPPYPETLRAALEGAGTKVFWNGAHFDIPILAANGFAVGGEVIDGMDAWHVLQSDLPRGGGFVWPFYSIAPAHKHHGTTSTFYCAMDGVQPLRAAYGIVRDLESEGLWKVYERYCMIFDKVVLRPAEKEGLLFERDKLEQFRDSLEVQCGKIDAEVQGLVPDDIKPLTAGLKRPKEGYFEAREVLTVLVCATCGASDLQARHRCEDRALTPAVTLGDAEVSRYYRRLPFNPDSWQQVLAYIKYRGHKPGKAKKTKQDSTDKKTLMRLVKTGDPLYPLVLENRKLSKFKGTYGDSIIEKIDPRGRVHPKFGHRPSTGRLSCKDPNFTNLPAGKASDKALSEAFRSTVVAERGSVLIAADYAGIEAVETGWFAKDPAYIRLARLGVHAYVTSHHLGRPADLKWTDEHLRNYFEELKETEEKAYDRCKKVVHGCLTGDHEVLTRQGWVRMDALEDRVPIAIWEPKERTSRFAIPRFVLREPHAGDVLDVLGRGFSAIATPEHRMTAFVGDKARDCTMETLPQHGRLPVTSLMDGPIAWTPRLALDVAIQADATFTSHRYVRFHLVRPRKIARLVSLLRKIGQPFLRRPCKCHRGGVRISFQKWEPTVIGLDKHFALETLMRLDPTAKKAFVAEVLHWDGSVNGHRRVFLSTSYEDARAVQTVSHLSGKQSLLREATSSRGTSFGGKPVWVVSFNRRQFARVDRLRVERRSFRGMIYCVNVPTEHFLVRHRDRIWVSKNTNYGLTPYGMSDLYPEFFPKRKDAEALQQIYFDVCPSIPRWHSQVRALAHKQKYLVTPYGWKHWFWDVVAFKRQEGRWVEGPGEDSKRCVAFLPQGQSAQVLMEAALRLFTPEEPHYIGDTFHGRTPLRALIHDEILLECEEQYADRVKEALHIEMTRPIPVQPCPSEWGIGEYLQVGVAMKEGRRWGPGMAKIGLPDLSTDVWREEEDEEEAPDTELHAAS